MISKLSGLSPSNFLAVTFSKKAAAEMLNRVELLVGEHKDELWISTFHAFCQRILKDHALDAGLSRNFRLLDRTEQWVFFKKLMPDLKLKYYINLADPFSPIHDFMRLISRCKDELVSPEAYTEYANNLPDDDEDGARQREAASVYAEYQKRMQEAGCLDFGDLINLTIRLFQQRPSVLAIYQEQFHYILVDEFQDTNIAQIELMSMLAAKRRNICVVGDDDQGIYRFRGASYASFIRFKQKFPDLTFLKLTQNYRSTKRILAVSESLIKNNNPDRYDPQKNLRTDNKRGSIVSMISTDDYDSEARIVTDKIKEIYKKEGGYSRIAVLYRAHNHNREIVKRLKAEGIPYSVAGPVGLFEREEIKDLVAVLSVLSDARDNVSLFRMLTMDAFGIDVSDVIELNRVAREKNEPLINVLRGGGSSRAVSKKTKTSISEFMKLLKHLLSLAHKTDIEKVFYEIVEKTGYIKNMVIGLDKENEVRLSNAGRFYNLINNYIREHEKIMLPAFMEYLSSYIEGGGDIAQESAVFDARDEVQLMTIHQAKGLEFPHVFVISLVQNRFPTRMRPEAIPFPVEMMKEELPKGNFHLQEERRLFYVAVTRARENLYISTVNKPYHKQSVFLNEIRREETRGNITRTAMEYDGEALTHGVKFGLSKKDFISANSKRKILGAIAELEESEDIGKGLPERLFKRIRTEYFSLVESLQKIRKEQEDESLQLPETFIAVPRDLKLSYTQLDTFINCPLKYKFNYVYHIPLRPSAPLRFGADVHDTLEEFYRKVKEGRAPTFADLHQIYFAHWNSTGYVNKAQEMQYQRNGLEMLKRFYETNKDNLCPPLYIEEEFLVQIGDSKFKGFIDRIDELPDGGIEIIDYKTGTPKDSRSAEKSVQLYIYAIACQDVLKLEPRFLSFYFLTNNQKVSVACEPEILGEIREYITSTVKRIKSNHFDPNPGWRCRWCDYRIICPAARL